MEAKLTSHTNPKPAYENIEGVGAVGQVAHPVNAGWDPCEAVEVLLAAATKLPDETRVVLTGGGFLTLNFLPTAVSRPVIRKGDFLEYLSGWTWEKLKTVIYSIEQNRDGRDFIIGVDVKVSSWHSGQFALWVGNAGKSLIAKRNPYAGEASYLAGVESDTPLHHGQRIIDTLAGPALVLICHDAQTFNHRNRGSVGTAQTETPRARAIREFDAARSTPNLAWALNLVHWIRDAKDTQTFRNSHSQMRKDFPRPVNVVASFGYDGSAQSQAMSLLRRMTSPESDFPKIIFH